MLMFQAFVPCGGFIWLQRGKREILRQLNSIDESAASYENATAIHAVDWSVMGIWSAMGKKQGRLISRILPFCLFS